MEFNFVFQDETRTPIENKLELLAQETEEQRDCENCPREECPMKKEKAK